MPHPPLILGLTTCLAFAGCAALAQAAPAAKAAPEPAKKEPWTPVPALDMKRYAGHWYEIARLDHSFERGLVGVTADYTLRPDGKYAVVNLGRKQTLTGKEDRSETTAWVPDPKKPGEFKAHFFLWLSGEYQVMAVGDAPDYGYALVGHPSLDYLWILSRTPELPPDVLKTLTAKAQALGYDTAKLIWVEQPKPPAQPQAPHAP